MLDLIGQALRDENIEFTRFDGGNTVEQRKIVIDIFRASPTVNILLVTIGSGSVGWVALAYLLDVRIQPLT